MECQVQTINRTATKKKVESILEQYRIYLLQVSLNKLPSITAKYTLVPASSNLVTSSTEKAAIANVDYEIERNRFIEQVIGAVNRLPAEERRLMILRYFGEEEWFDYQVYNEMNMSERHYYRLKARAFSKFAIALNVEVYQER
ncbi:ArpU family phage packaging/lysis transcriptional regulator [Chungangia koreensis]|uniref:ArpU family phage packaging/lysis transcriptional regulator n=1 Tax=Chungangia koreensis TaxID=752657 RepID=A0ABV8X9W7_9LACT